MPIESDTAKQVSFPVFFNLLTVARDFVVTLQRLEEVVCMLSAYMIDSKDIHGQRKMHGASDVSPKTRRMCNLVVAKRRKAFLQLLVRKDARLR